jgi:hypothetical protein
MTAIGHLLDPIKADPLSVTQRRQLALRQVETSLGYFDPGSIEELGDRDLPACLRALADAIEKSQLDGKLISVRGNGFTKLEDRRMHVTVSIDLAAGVRKEITV